MARHRSRVVQEVRYATSTAFQDLGELGKQDIGGSS